MTVARLAPKDEDEVRSQVAGFLGKSAAFKALPAQARRDITDHTVTVVSAMATAPRGKARRARPDPYAFAQEELDGTSTETAPPDRWRPDDRFQAEGIREGVTQIGRLINEVNFPGFVASLLQGTFQAIVDASLQQMKAYGELVQSVAMSLNEFRDQNVDEFQGQQRLVSKYPNVFQFGQDSGLPKLDINPDFDFDSLPDFQKELGLPEPVMDLDEETLQNILIPAARLEVARSRQQLLATTVLMGINRIIVTDGRINAKLRFSFHAADSIQRQGTVDDYEITKKVLDVEQGIGNRYAKGHFELPVPIKVSTATGTGAADIEAQAQLSGDVSINFRSETFPLERMVDTDQLMRLNAARGPTAQAPAVPAAPAPAVAAPAPTPAVPVG